MLRASSRLIVDGLRPNRLAIDRIDTGASDGDLFSASEPETPTLQVAPATRAHTALRAQRAPFTR